MLRSITCIRTTLLLVLLIFLSSSPLLHLNLIVPTNATGQGTVGIHAINDRYVLVTDSNVLSLIIVDVLLGGVVGILTFPKTWSNVNVDVNVNTTDSNSDIHFIGVTSCDTCLYIHVDKMHWHFPNSTEDHILEIGPLERPLLDMANDSNFTAFNALSSSLSLDYDRGVMRPVWPFPKKYLNYKTDMRMIRSHPRGGVGYLARHHVGVLRYKLDSRGKMIPGAGEVLFRIDNKITGINLSSTYQRLVAVGKKTVYILDISSEKNIDTGTGTDTDNVSESKFESNDNNEVSANFTVEEISLTNTCMNGRYRNSVLWDDDPTSQVMIVDGHDGTGMGGGIGVVLQKLTRGVSSNSDSDSNSKNGNNGTITTSTSTSSTWDNCEIVLGDAKERVGWRDGCGTTARFTRPHDMMLLPQSGRLVLTDIDNRAIRLVEPSPRQRPAYLNVDSDYNNDNATTSTSASTTCVSTISYDEGLYMKLFPDFSESDDNDNDNHNIDNYIDNNTNDEHEERNTTTQTASIDNMVRDSGEVVVSSSSSNRSSEPVAPLREPYTLDTPTEVDKITFETAQVYCQSSFERDNSDICTLEEVRTLFRYSYVHNTSTINNILSNPFWTKESCEGCWKHYKGICTDDDPSWDSDYHMVTAGRNLDPQSPNERGLLTACLQDDESITPTFQYIHVVCCGDRRMEETIIDKNESEYSEVQTLNSVGFSLVVVLLISVFVLYFLSTKVKRSKEPRYKPLESTESC